MSREYDLESLIARVAEGDRKAFSAFYSATSAKVFGLLIRIFGDRQPAEEALPEVYFRAWHGAGKYAALGLTPMTWILTITRNLAVEQLRAQREEGLRDASLSQAALEGNSPGPEVHNVETCLTQLDADRAEAIRIAYLDGFTYELLADRYEVPLNTVRTWLRQSMLSLREYMAR